MSFNLKYGTLNDAGNAPYIVISMFTSNYEDLAIRLRDSLEAHSLHFAIYEVPEIDISISPKYGKDRPDLSKPAFIKHVASSIINIESVERNVRAPCILYMDCDLIVRDDPTNYFKLGENPDFAIFNWLAVKNNAAYVPLSIISSGQIDIDYIYTRSHSINWYDPTKLICSGPVQLWNFKSNSEGALVALLDDWHQCIIDNRGTADDECLSYVFNSGDFINRLHTVWLPKTCIRYGWWIFDKPVIDHPSIPNIIVCNSSEDMVKINSSEFNKILLESLPPQCKVLDSDRVDADGPYLSTGYALDIKTMTVYLMSTDGSGTLSLNPI